MKILLMGATLRSGNRGVNALTRGTIEAFTRKFDVRSFKILRIAREQGYTEKICANGNVIQVEEITCTAYKLIQLMIVCFLKKLTFTSLLDKYLRKDEILKHIYEANVVLDISEGDSFSDIYGKKRFIIHSFNKLIALALGKRLILLPQTIGPFDNYFVRNTAKYILSKADYVLTRDELSYKLCCANSSDSLNINTNKVSIVPDMAFFMDPTTDIDISSIIGELDNTKGRLLVGLNVSGLLYSGGYTKNNMFNLKLDYKSITHRIIEELAGKQEVSLLLVPHVITYGNEIVEDDLTICKKLHEEFLTRFPGKISYVDKPYRENELKQIIGACDFFVGARMHACIGAISMQVPTVPIAYSRKFLGVWQMFGMEAYVADPRNQREEEIVSIIYKAIEDRNTIKLKLQKEMQIVREKIALAIQTIG